MVKGHTEKAISCTWPSSRNKTYFNNQFLGPIESDVLPVGDGPSLRLFTASSGIQCTNSIHSLSGHVEQSHFTRKKVPHAFVNVDKY